MTSVIVVTGIVLVVVLGMLWCVLAIGNGDDDSTDGA